MAKAFVVLSSDQRREIIVTQAEKIAAKLKLKPILAQDLLNEVVGLVEYPNVLLGKIEPEFLGLPKEVLISAMKTHQRYFYLEDAQGKIAPYFLVASNVKHQNDELIIAGNEKVLKARLADAKFFLEQDLKQPIGQSLAKLARRVFHNKLGTMFDKTNRIVALAVFIAEKLKFVDLDAVKKAALISKTDLVSEMVGEFPELQGIMGKYYAKAFGETEEVALAIAEHYRPVDTNDMGDISLLSTIIAIADKLDSIIGLWLAGEKPSSSKDPFALRRSALGIIKLIRYHKLNISITELITKAAEGYQLAWNESQQQEVILFFNDRLKYYFKAENFRHDLIMASLNFNSNNINDASKRLVELQEFLTDPKAEALCFAIKRILNILAQAKNLDLNVKQELLKPVELALYNKTLSTKATLNDLVGLVDYINQFFDEILVNDADFELKQNRLNLLYNVASLSNQFADFNLIAG